MLPSKSSGSSSGLPFQLTPSEQLAMLQQILGTVDPRDQEAAAAAAPGELCRLRSSTYL